MRSFTVAALLIAVSANAAWADCDFSRLKTTIDYCMSEDNRERRAREKMIEAAKESERGAFMSGYRQCVRNGETVFWADHDPGTVKLIQIAHSCYAQESRIPINYARSLLKLPPM